MRVRVITPPPPLVTWEEADARLKLDGDEAQKPFVEALIAAASGHVDGPGGCLGRAIGVQTLEARGECFWPTGYRLLYPPHIDVESVEYLDGAGVMQTLDPARYELDDREIVPAYGTSWPGTRDARSAVRVRYRAGYVADPAGDPLVAKIPEPIRAAVLLLVGDLYRFRETVVVGATAAAVPMSATVNNLLAPFRVIA